MRVLLLLLLCLVALVVARLFGLADRISENGKLYAFVAGAWLS